MEDKFIKIIVFIDLEAREQLNDIINQNTKSNMRLKDLMGQISEDVENAKTVYPVMKKIQFFFYLYKG